MAVVRTILKWSLMAVSAVFLLGLLLMLGLAFYIAPSLPAIDELKSVDYHVPLRVYSAEGSLLAEFGEKRRVPLEIDEIPENLKAAVIAAEDDRFYQHPGVDYKGLIRAALKLARTGEKTQGGSTITMQVARNFFLNRERTYSRKLREILLAMKIEQKLSKDEILALYLNQNYMGNRAYGVGAAAETYYGKSLQELSLDQLAMLAGLYKAPSRFNPIVNPERAKARRNYVLRRMAEQGYISESDAAEAQSAALSASMHSPKPAITAHYAAEMVRSALYEQYGDELYQLGLSVYTTIKDDLQSSAVAALRKGLSSYDARHGYRGAEKNYDISDKSLEDLGYLLENYAEQGGLHPALVLSSDKDAASIYLGDGESAVLTLDAVDWARPYVDENTRGDKPRRVDAVVKEGDLIRVVRGESGWRLAQLPAVEGALVSISSRDGAILALQGGFDYFRSRFNRATQAIRQPGSSFKPFVYSAGLNSGLTPATTFNDAPIVEETEISGEAAYWRPENYSGRFYGPTRMRVALAKSRNLVSIRLLRKIGVRSALRHIDKFRLTDRKMPADLSLALGTGGLTPLELVGGFAVFANQGYRVEPYLISRIEDRDGAVVFEARPSQVCDPACEKALSEQGQEAQMTMNRAERVLDKENAYQITSMLQDVIRIGTGHRARELGRNDLAGKTGTTNDQRDAWFTGFNPDIATTVWVGFDKVKPLGKNETGGRLALPIWMDFMRDALQGQLQKPWKKPAGMVTVKIDADTGMRAGPSTKKFAFETFRADNVPEEAVQTAAPEGAEIPEQIF